MATLSGNRWRAGYVLLLLATSGFFATIRAQGAGPTGAAGGNRPEATHDGRVIVFPADRSLGRLSVRDAGTEGLTGWTELGEARGPIEIPPHKEAKLDIDDETYRNLPFLVQLGPDDLQEINIYPQNLKDADLAYLAGFTGLKRLGLMGPVTGAGLARLKTMESLALLWLIGTEVDDEGLAYLAALASLDTIYLWSNNRISGVGFRHFMEAERLRKLDFYRTPVNDEGAGYISQIPSLVELSLHYTEVTDIGLARLTRLPQLRHLVLPPKATDDSLTDLKRLESLESLRIMDTRITDGGLARLRDLRRLRSLVVHSTLMTGEGLVCLRGMTSLEEVILNLPMMTPAGLDSMEGLPVIDLNLRETAVGDDELALLQGQSRLANLSLRGTHITATGLSHLRRLSGLRTLDLAHTETTNEGLAHLEAMTALRSLDLTGCPVNDEGLVHLKRLGFLKDLNLRSTQVSAAGVQAIKASLPECQVTGTGRPRQEPDPAAQDAAKSLIGKPAPELAFTGLLQAPPDTPVTWERLKGKVVVLEFWATWCGPCLRALPHLNAMVERFRDRPVQFISVTSEQEPVVADYLQRHLLKGWVALDQDGAMYESYRLRGIPCTVVVDRNGIIVQVTHPTELAIDAIEGLLSENDK